MKVSLSVAERNYGLIFPGIDVSIPMQFNGKQPRLYGVPSATSKPYEGDGFIGDTRQGGSVNFETISLNPHCNGTHTECVGHLSLSRISIQKVLKESLQPATLITLQPKPATLTSDTYSPEFQANDFVIDHETLLKALQDSDEGFVRAIVVRTLPNHREKAGKDYSIHTPPFFTLEAMKFLRSLNVHHLVVDLPSVDRQYDEGRVSAHHIFWEVPAGSSEVDAEIHSLNTITELAFIPDEVEDGKYLLNLQIAPFESDAAPSRPVLYRLKEIIA